MRVIALVVLVPLAVATLAGLIWLWPGAAEKQVQERPDQVAASVVELYAMECAEELPDDVNGCGTAVVEFEDAEANDGTSSFEIDLPNGPGAPLISEGDQVLLVEMQNPDGVEWHIVDHQRSTGLWILTGAFCLAVIAFGRLRGLRSLVGLGVTFGVLIWFLVPAILNGTAPVTVALVACSAIVLVVMHLTHGRGLVTTVAVLGTLASLALTCLLAWFAVDGLFLSGVTDDISTSVALNFGVDARGLLLAGIMIGSLGVLDDVTVTQSATVAEIARANPSYRFRELYAAGARVGRAHIASVINTIVLAYAGSSLPLIILILANNDSLSAVLTDQLVAQELVRSAVATLGLIAAVPMTTALAAWTSRGQGDDEATPAPAAGRRVAGR